MADTALTELAQPPSPSSHVAEGEGGGHGEEDGGGEVDAADDTQAGATADADTATTTTAPDGTKLLSTEEYNAKAEALESRLKRIEGRENKEFNLHTWFCEQDSSVTVQKLEKKGLGMVSRRQIPDNSVIMTCPPYSCVPYEGRKMTTCAYCMKDTSPPPPPAAPIPAHDPPATPTPHDDSNGNSTSNDSNDQSATTSTQSVEHEQYQQAPQPDPNPGPPRDPEPEPIEMIECEHCHEIWYCSEECQQMDAEEHNHNECRSLANMDVKWAKDYYQYCDDLITDVRLMIRVANKRSLELTKIAAVAAATKSTTPPSITEFDQEYQLLISNKDCYNEETLASLRGVVQYANYLMPPEIQIPEDDLLDVYCKHRVNMFGLWGTTGECLGYGVYPRASYFNHSCWPNTTFYKNTEHRIPHMDFLTVFPIEGSDEEVCISYIDISTDLASRRNTLLDKYFFHCTCERCVWQEANPTEPDPYHKYWAPGATNPTSEALADPSLASADYEYPVEGEGEGEANGDAPPQQ